MVRTAKIMCKNKCCCYRDATSKNVLWMDSCVLYLQIIVFEAGQKFSIWRILLLKVGNRRNNHIELGSFRNVLAEILWKMFPEFLFHDLPLLLRSVVFDDSKLGTKLLKLSDPIGQCGEWNDDQVGKRWRFVLFITSSGRFQVENPRLSAMFQPCQEGNGLNGFSLQEKKSIQNQVGEVVSDWMIA